MKKELLIGVVVGLIANVIGLYFATSFLGNGEDVVSVLKAASSEGFLGKLISFGSHIKPSGVFCVY